MKALVTGVAGFVGRHLVSHLEARGDTVTGIDREHGIDLLDPSALTGAVAEAAPDAVYHLGGWSDVGGSWAAPRDAFRVNAEGTLNVLEACRAAGVSRVLLVSSADVYGKVSLSELPLTEESPFRPVTPYAASKIAADELGLQAWLGYGLEVLRVRAFNHLGPGQTNRFVCPALAERIALNELEGREVVTVGNLTPRRDFTDVRDVVRAYRLSRRRRRTRRGLQRVLGSRHRHRRTGRPPRRHGRATRCASRATPHCNGPSTYPFCAATTRSSTKPRGGTPRSSSNRPCATYSTSGGPESPDRADRSASALVDAERPDPAERVIERCALSLVVALGSHRGERALPSIEHQLGLLRRNRLEPRHVVFEQGELQLDLGVLCDDGGQAIGLGERVVGVGDQVVRSDLEQPGQQGHGALTGHRHARFEVRNRNAGHGESLCELLLGPAELGAVRGQPPTERFSMIGP